MKILVTGGTVFVSKYIAQYFVKKNQEVYVLNRGSKKQVEGVHFIEGDRGNLGDTLKNRTFDVVIDVAAYTREDMEKLLNSGIEFKDYVFISSSAVYPEYGIQPFKEEGEKARNIFWGDYGTNKIEAEESLLAKVKDAYILRPPYLYGTYNNVYREAFVFDCAMKHRKFYLPGKGDMKLQFFHVEDLCRMIEILLEQKPEHRILNVGNEETISIKEWVSLCYEAAGEQAEFVEVDKQVPQRSYFPFSDYEYVLDIEKQRELLKETKPLYEGLCEAFSWYKDNQKEVNQRDYIGFIEEQLS